MSPVFRVLHVCTGNICRSPMAEHLTRDGLARRLGAQAGRFEISSAGTWAQDGFPMEADALATLTSYGSRGGGTAGGAGPATGAAAFRSRELTVEQVRDADLVLTATREHRAAVVRLLPRAAARTFTLLELHRLVAGVDGGGLPADDVVERAGALVRAAAARRGVERPARPADDDVADPYRAPAAAFRQCAELIQASLARPLDLIAGAGPASP